MKTYLAKIYYSWNYLHSKKMWITCFYGVISFICFLLLLIYYVCNIVPYWAPIFSFYIFHQIIMFDSFFHSKVISFLCNQFEEISEESKKFNQENK